MPLLQLPRFFELRLARDLGELLGQGVVGDLLGGRQLCLWIEWVGVQIAEVRCSRLGLDRDTVLVRHWSVIGLWL